MISKETQVAVSANMWGFIGLIILIFPQQKTRFLNILPSLATISLARIYTQHHTRGNMYTELLLYMLSTVITGKTDSLIGLIVIKSTEVNTVHRWLALSFSSEEN